MSCSRECFYQGEKYFAHNNCDTCPGQDSGPSETGSNYCATCKTTHLIKEWPHPPVSEPSAAHEKFAKEINLQTLGIPNFAYGLFIDIDIGREMIKQVMEAPAKNKIEVAVRYNGVTREFKMKEFLTVLGFEYEAWWDEK